MESIPHSPPLWDTFLGLEDTASLKMYIKDHLLNSTSAAQKFVNDFCHIFHQIVPTAQYVDFDEGTLQREHNELAQCPSQLRNQTI